MSVIRFIGDVHGKFDKYVRLVNESPYPTIQVGDFGMGFVPNPVTSYDTHIHQFIRGNHDDPAKCELEPNWIPDGTYRDGIFFVGGAESTDKHLRTEGVSWWAQEELSHEQLWAIADDYEKIKPAIVISHDVPEPVCHYMLGYPDWRISRTKQGLTSLLSIHRPKLWIFGHYHKPYDDVIDGTRFICLPELEHIDVDTSAFIGSGE